jgi:2-iminobutanoate/2-iminopropanoate deaminase
MRFTFVLAALLLLVGPVSATDKAYKPRQIRVGSTHGNARSSGAVLVGNTLYIAGRIGLDPKSGTIPGDIDQEARNLLDGFKAVLAKAGMTADDLVNVQVFCPDPSLFSRWNTIYRSYFKKDFPQHSFIGSGPLLLNAHFEMQGAAVRGGAEALKKRHLSGALGPTGE